MIELDPSSVTRVPIWIGISGICFKENWHYFTNDVSKDIFFNEDADNKTPIKLNSLLMTSLQNYENHSNGVL